MTGMKFPLTSDLLRTKFEETLSADHKLFITDVQLKKSNLAIIYCKTWENCKTLVSTYKEFNGEKVQLKMFAGNNPHSSTK